MTFLRAVWAGTIRRLRRVPTYMVRLWRWLVTVLVGPPLTANPHYVALREKAERGEQLDVGDVNRVIVPLLVERGKQIERLRSEIVVPYFVIFVMLLVFAYVGQQFLAGTRQAARVNCTVIANLVTTSGADGSPTLAGELQQTYREELEEGMDERRLRKVRSLQDQIARTGVRVRAPNCDQVVNHPESVRPVTIPKATVRP